MKYHLRNVLCLTICLLLVSWLICGIYDAIVFLIHWLLSLVSP